MKRSPRRYWREPRAAVLWLLCFLAVWWWSQRAADTPSVPELLDEGIHKVRRVIDGDTIVLESGARVRLQGIDTPETVLENVSPEPWGPEASQFTKDFIAQTGRQVRLTFSLERKDRHDRFLAFVWNGDVLLNEELVRAGLAHARLDYRYSDAMKRRLAKAQSEARKAGRGIWSTQVVPFEGSRRQ